MKINLVGSSKLYELQSLCQIFYPGETFKETYNESLDSSDKILTVELTDKYAYARCV